MFPSAFTALPEVPELEMEIWAVPEIEIFISAEMPFPSAPVLLMLNCPPERLMLVSDVKLAVEKLSATPETFV